MHFLTVIAKIKDGAAAGLRTILAEIDNDQAGNPYVRFPESGLTHFARFVILTDPEHGARLLFAANYDGGLRAYLKELLRIAPDLDGVWRNCEGYRGRNNFIRFMSRHARRNRGTYVGFPDETVESVRTKIAIRRQLEHIFDRPGAAEALTQEQFNILQHEVRRLVGAPTRCTQFVRAFGNVWLRAFKWIHGIFFGLFLRFAKWYSEYGMAQTFDTVNSTCQRSEPLKWPPPVPVRGQSSFTVYAKVQRGKLWRMWIALAASNILSRFAYRTGEFANVYTLHEFRWIILDRGKRLIFMSSFDGTWENYMGDFINNLVWALDAIYSNTQGYPPAGMKDVYRFKQWIRDHQPLPSVVYNAYADTTALNMLRDRAISDALVAGGQQSVARCLELL